MAFRALVAPNRSLIANDETRLDSFTIISGKLEQRHCSRRKIQHNVEISPNMLLFTKEEEPHLKEWIIKRLAST